METFRFTSNNSLIWIVVSIISILILHYGLKKKPRTLIGFTLILSVGIYYLPSAIENTYRLLNRPIYILEYLPPVERVPDQFKTYYSDYLSEISMPDTMPLILLLIGVVLVLGIVRNIPDEKLRRVCRDFCYFFTLSIVIATITSLILHLGFWEFIFLVFSGFTGLSIIRAGPSFIRGFWAILKLAFFGFIIATHYITLFLAKGIKYFVKLLEHPIQFLNHTQEFIKDIHSRAFCRLERAKEHVVFLLENERLESSDQQTT